jgi:hypothetical protein
MRKGNRDEDKQGLAEERRSLIRRYMADRGEGPSAPSETPPPGEPGRDQPPAPVATVHELPVEERETLHDALLPAPGPEAAVQFGDEPRDLRGEPAQTIAALDTEGSTGEPPSEAGPRLRLLPPKSQRTVEIDLARQMLGEVLRLSQQVDWLGNECRRRRARLAVAVPQRPSAPSDIPAD